MVIQKIPQYVDSILTREDASAALRTGQIEVGWYTNQSNSQSVVHSHPYYEIVLPVAGSVVRYSIDGSIYDLHVGEMIIFPAGLYHAGVFNITDSVSKRMIVQINADLWAEALYQSGLEDCSWHGQLVILDADAVALWDLRGLFERMAQSAYLTARAQIAVQCCEVAELTLLLDHTLEHQCATPPGATSVLVSKAVAYLQANYTDPQLTVAQLAKYTYTSREHLSRVFREYTLESVHGYLTNLRMQHCRNAIAAGSSVLDACTSSGFTNYSSFLKSFRQLYGVTPSEYRAQLRITKRDGQVGSEN